MKNTVNTLAKSVSPIKIGWTSLLLALVLNGCDNSLEETKSTPLKNNLVNPSKDSVINAQEKKSYYGTLEPFASEAIYFAMTDRFVDGDPSNNYPQQGGQYPTAKGELQGSQGKKAYVGYMGGDFKGILSNAQYIKDMGFTAIWLTPVVDNPNESFSGGEPIEFGGAFKDGLKSGYHGYWGVNFFKEDEHWISKDLDYQQLASRLQDDFEIKLVLDVVANHGSPAFTMPGNGRDDFGKLYNENDVLVADHQNLPPESLDYDNPLHKFYNRKKDIMQLSDMNETNPDVLDYFVRAHSSWLDKGAAAVRIDTIKHMPHEFWKKFADGIRTNHPNTFMFAESYSFDPHFIAEHTLEKNGGISVLDFPGREAMVEVFENKDSDYKRLLDYLHLQGGPYANPYELTTFYDNHDMPRINTDEEGYIDVNNWLFTSRGIPVVYYGSEIGFMSGTAEHAGNRNYFGQNRVELAKAHPIRLALSRIANVRKKSIALQRGLQVNLEFSGNTASFFRVFEHEGVYQTALVLLNKGEVSHEFSIRSLLSNGQWQSAMTGEKIAVADTLKALVPPHSVDVYLYQQPTTNSAMLQRLNELMN